MKNGWTLGPSRFIRYPDGTIVEVRPAPQEKAEPSEERTENEPQPQEPTPVDVSCNYEAVPA